MENMFHVQIIIRNGAMELWKQKHKILKIWQNRNKEKNKQKPTKKQQKNEKDDIKNAWKHLENFDQKLRYYLGHLW